MINSKMPRQRELRNAEEQEPNWTAVIYYNILSLVPFTEIRKDGMLSFYLSG